MNCYGPPHRAPARTCRIVCQAKGKGASKKRKRAPAPQQDAASSTESQSVVSTLAGPALKPAEQLEQDVLHDHCSHPSEDSFPSRGQVWRSCAVTCGGIAALGLGVRQYAATLAPSVAHTDPEAVAALLKCESERLCRPPAAQAAHASMQLRLQSRPHIQPGIYRLLCIAGSMHGNPSCLQCSPSSSGSMLASCWQSLLESLWLALRSRGPGDLSRRPAKPQMTRQAIVADDG